MRRSGGLRRYIHDTRKSKTLNNASVEECRIFAYYLYVICSYKLECYPDAEDNEDYLYGIFGFFDRLANKMGQGKAVLNYLSKVIIQYQNHKMLKEIPDFEMNENFCFDGTDIPFTYEEDRKIDRVHSCNMPIPSLLVIDLMRIHYVSRSLDFLLGIIANYLIRRTPAAEITRLQRLPLQLKSDLAELGNFEFVKKEVGLSDEEIRLLQCNYRCYTNRTIASILNTFTETCQKEILARILGISVRQYSALTRQDSKLRLYGFIDEEGKIEDDFFDCVEMGSMQPYFCDLLKRVDCSSCYKMESFNVSDKVKNLMSRMLKSDQSLSLLLYGKPGSGKTEFAKTLAKESGLKVYVFKNERELSGEKDQNVLARLNCLLSMNSTDSLYIIDEADSLLRTCDSSFFGMKMPSKIKGTVNKMLEESRNKIIWIVNFTSQIDESTLRRFTYSCKFDSMTRKQLRSITASKLKTLELPEATNNQILDLMEQYKVTGASVDNVIKTIKCLGCGENAGAGDVSENNQPLVQSVKSVLKENSLLINGKNTMRESVSSTYDLSVLNASMEPAHIVRMVQNARDFAEKSNTANEAQNGIRMLFYGVSGTGKTEFARYIAQQLGKKILLKRVSDIMSKWVGETEQNIRDAFDEAVRTDSILLFDEADSFFADRNGAQHSWERTQVNEFLTQMEEFPGILICTTNLKNIMDAAMNRRFHIITEFRPLEAEGIRSLLGRYFAGMVFEEKEICRLKERNSVTPGDFSVLASRVRFMDEGERTARYIIDELCKIQEEKEGVHKTIGFSVA